ncbi:MacB family efflux pump subunit [Sinirhodobacter populi]|uniref:Pyoverdine export ATP-binding/permease protein PvdT n=1 Tax=Paenirhodobacter populi TaxID=2306993 RepID=A0A443KN44_9RHOB|nr:MacB family efflux pump subunit [Sinirhodobacter populi]RWR34221.1 MacB family efflux pump subunit [Sinirhodobacter populi]
MTGPDTTQPLISIRDVTRSFQAGEETITVLHGVSLDIRAGEMVAIIGQSGSGKSTLMNILGCLDRPTSGTYRFAGRDVEALDPDQLAQLRREHFGFIFQRYQLLGDLDAVENVEVPAVYAGEAGRARRLRAEELLQQLGLGERLDHRPSELSGGQQQRVSVARALMNGGEVILADEPTGALDTKSGEDLIALLLELNRQGHTIIVVTHDPKVAAHARRVIEIRDGAILSDKSTGPAEPAPVASATPRRRATLSGAAAGIRRFTEAFHSATKAMLAHRLRSFLTMLGIIIGIASVVLVVALGNGTQQKVLDNISSLGTNTITVRAGSGFGRRDANRIQTLVPSDAEAIAAQDYAVGASPAVSTSKTVVSASNSASVSINGVSGDYFGVHNYATIYGSTFDDTDVEGLAQVAVLDEDTLSTFFPSGNAIGQVLMIGQVPVRVIGVVRSSGATFGPSSLNLWVPYTTAMSRITGQTYLSSIGVRVADDHDMTEAQERITELLTLRHGTQDFWLQNSDTIRSTITSTTQTMTWLVAAIALISLVVGGIGVMNIMLVSVTERTREIGVRVAVGARRSDIVSQFLIEAVLVCLVGGVLGILTAVGAGALISSLSADTRLAFSPLAIALAFFSSTLIGITFGFLPARSAAKLDPVVALNRE